MTQVIKIALPGYNASTDTNPDHFALYVDQQTDYILIKEKSYATVSVTGSRDIAHNLGYIPFCLVFQEISNGVWRKVFSTAIDGVGASFMIDGTNLKLIGTGTFSYRIFYDEVT